MKTISVISGIILILLIFNSCKNYYGFEKTELKQNYLYVDYLIKNTDSLYIVFQDTLKVHKSNSTDEWTLRFTSDLLKKNIIKGKFQDGYDFVDEKIEYVYADREKKEIDYFHYIKIRSKQNKGIIWFEFINESRTSWKLISFHFCNNFNERLMSPEVPCDKD